jgi:hypothetical protein
LTGIFAGVADAGAETATGGVGDTADGATEVDATGAAETATEADVEVDAEGTAAGVALFDGLQAATNRIAKTDIFFMPIWGHENLKAGVVICPMADKVGQFRNEPPIRVKWVYLERADLQDTEDARHRSRCPKCEQGLLLVRWCWKSSLCFSCFDRCIECGQRFVYGDEEILGTRVLTPKEIEVLDVMES